MPAGTPTVHVQATPPAKPWYCSRMLWLNVLVLVLAAAESRLGMLQQLLSVDLYQAIAFILPVLNAALRLVTTTAISGTTGSTGTTPPPQEDAP